MKDILKTSEELVKCVKNKVKTKRFNNIIIKNIYLMISPQNFLRGYMLEFTKDTQPVTPVEILGGTSGKTLAETARKFLVEAIR